MSAKLLASSLARLRAHARPRASRIALVVPVLLVAVDVLYTAFLPATGPARLVLQVLPFLVLWAVQAPKMRAAFAKPDASGSAYLKCLALPVALVAALRTVARYGAIGTSANEAISWCLFADFAHADHIGSAFEVLVVGFAVVGLTEGLVYRVIFLEWLRSDLQYVEQLGARLR